MLGDASAFLLAADSARRFFYDLTVVQWREILLVASCLPAG